MLLLLTLLQVALAEPRARTTEIGWERPTGVGAALGQPTGVTAKRYLDRRARHAIDGTLAVHSLTRGYGGLYGHAAYLFHPSTLWSSPSAELPWHVGAGPFFGTTAGIDPHDPPGWLRYPYPRPNTGFAGIRTTVGLDLDLIDVPFQVFLDVSPSLTVVPRPWVSFGSTLGVRYYF